MNQINYHQQATQVLCFPEQQNSNRCQAQHLLAITPKGTGQIIDISGAGLSFGCLYHHYFQNEWIMDILDAQGTHIKQLKVKKIWQRGENHSDISSEFEMEIGVEFLELTQDQIHELETLTNNIKTSGVRYAPNPAHF